MEATLEEPEKCEEWRWVAWEAIPEPVFMPLQVMVEKGFQPRPSDASQCADFRSTASAVPAALLG